MEMVLMAGTPAGVPQGVEGPGTNLVSLERKKCASHRNMCFVHEERDIDKYHLRSRQPKFPLRIVHEIEMECRRTGMEALDPLVKTNSTTLRIPHSLNLLGTLDVAETLDYLFPPSSSKLQCQVIE